MKNLIDLTRTDFDSVVSKNKTVVLDFWAPWCGPCKRMEPVIEALATKYPDVIFGKVSVDEQSELASAFGVMSIPTYIVLKNGQVSTQFNGLQTEEQFSAKLSG